MKKVFILCAVILTGCATSQWTSPVTKADRFDCDQKCGVYNSNIGVLESAICVNRCLDSKGYKLK